VDLGFKPDNGLEIDLFQFSRYMLQTTFVLILKSLV